MDGEKMKRKIEDVDEEEKEEEKIEKFFALIKSTKELRERMNINSGTNENKEKVGPQAAAAAAAAVVWSPKFRLEDFMEVAPPPGSEAAAGPSSLEEIKSDKINGDKGLDLNLSL